MKTFVLKGTIGVLAVLFVFSSCIRQQKTWILQEQEATEGINQFTNPKKTAYKVQPGDNLYINVYSADKATSAYFQSNFPTVMNPTYLYLNSYIVNEDGYLTFSFIDKIMVEGLTVEEIQDKLQTTMNTYFKDVTVSVKMVSFDISVLGEVEDPKKFTVTKEQSNIFEALAISGGLKEYADLEKVVLVRQTKDGSVTHTLNLKDKSILASEYYYLMPNDVVYVPSLKSKTYTYEKVPYNLFISSLSIIIAILAITL